MPKIEVSEEQILSGLDELSPAARREALRRLLPSSTWWDARIDRNDARIRELARERGVDWDSLSEERRQELVDRILHEA